MTTINHGNPMNTFPVISANKRSRSQRTPIHGVGINDAPYMTNPRIGKRCFLCPFFEVWRSMIRRCYSEKYQINQPTYIGCEVDKGWHSFMAFREWMMSQDWHGKHLDKDLMVAGNKVYSKELCMFVSKRVNNILNDHGARRGCLPIGVCLFEGKYMAQCSGAPKRYLGLFDTANEAHEAWRTAKINVIKSVANDEKDPIKSHLLKFTDLI